MTPRIFFDVENPDPEPSEGYDDTGCTCPPGDNRYQMEISDGGVSLTHTTCGKQPPASWGDWNELFYMDPIPVTVEWDRNCDGSPWHGMDPCDCDFWIQATPTGIKDYSQVLPHRPCHQVTYDPKRKPHDAHHYRIQNESYWCIGLPKEAPE